MHTECVATSGRVTVDALILREMPRVLSTYLQRMFSFTVADRIIHHQKTFFSSQVRHVKGHHINDSG